MYSDKVIKPSINLMQSKKE